jgi:metallophosphoesterase superfamily enzyme
MRGGIWIFSIDRGMTVKKLKSLLEECDADMEVVVGDCFFEKASRIQKIDPDRNEQLWDGGKWVKERVVVIIV